jgi:hypothetical protein
MPRERFKHDDGEILDEGPMYPLRIHRDTNLLSVPRHEAADDAFNVSFSLLGVVAGPPASIEKMRQHIARELDETRRRSPRNDKLAIFVGAANYLLKCLVAQVRAGDVKRAVQLAILLGREWEKVQAVAFEPDAKLGRSVRGDRSKGARAKNKKASAARNATDAKIRDKWRDRRDRGYASSKAASSIAEELDISVRRVWDGLKRLGITAKR